MSRKTVVPFALCLSVAMSTQASAQFLTSRTAPVDPEEKMSRLAAASTPQDADHGRPAKRTRTILKDDPYLRAAFSGITGN